MSATTKTAPPLRSTTTRSAPRPRRSVRRWLVAGTAYIVAIIFLLPYLEMIVMAGRPNDELGDPTIFPKHFTFSNFTTLWSSGGLGGSIGTSLEIAAGATVVALLVALPAAYYTARHRFRGRTVFLLLVLATQMFQPAAMLVGLQREFINFGLAPTLSLTVINAGFNLAFAVWILNAFFSSIPVELEEAGMVDGLGKVGALLRITLPLAAPGIVTALIFTFISAWNEFLVAADGRDQPVHRGVLRRLGASLRGRPGRDRARDHLVHLHRAACRRRPDGRSGQMKTRVCSAAVVLPGAVGPWCGWLGVGFPLGSGERSDEC
jgi:multiple sugar transport system permease protein